MEIKPLDNFTKGWFIGNFFPSMDPRDDFEIAVKRYKAGEKEGSHVHKVATEYTVVLNGTVKFNCETVHDGNIVVVSPGEYIKFEALTDVDTVVVKTPCVKGDKYVEEKC